MSSKRFILNNCVMGGHGPFFINLFIVTKRFTDTKSKTLFSTSILCVHPFVCSFVRHASALHHAISSRLQNVKHKICSICFRDDTNVLDKNLYTHGYQGTLGSLGGSTSNFNKWKNFDKKKFLCMLQ